ncbi:MAG: DIP1984 family protein [Anaerolineae bacterium]|nr:DIP1984 family protein [Anaerolineae bacterium]
MILAEALILRADINKRIEQIRTRLGNVVRIQEGDAPAENPAELLAELDRTLKQLNLLIKQINRTNSQTRFDDDRTLTDALADRDTLMLQRTALQGVIKQASDKQHRYGLAEIREVVTIDVGAVIQQVDTLSQQYRLLDTEIQRLNWIIDLVE